MRFIIAFTLLAFLGSAAGPAGAIGPGDLKKKLGKKLKEKVEKKEDEAAEAAAGAAEDAAGGAKEKGRAKEEAAPGGKSTKGAPSGEDGPKRAGAVASVSAKFDFIPGDRTLSAADFGALRAGPPPSAWKPRRGDAAVEDVGGGRWLVPKGETVVFRIPLEQPLPMKWTLEIDYALEGAEGASFQLAAQTASGASCWSASWPRPGGSIAVEGAGTTASGGGGGASTGRHRIAFAGSGPGLRVYLDRERVVAAPGLLQGEPPASLLLTTSRPANRPMIASARLASGPASAKARLADGSLATYGVRFDSASDEVRPESAPVLREVASYLESDGAAKLSIRVRADDVAEEGRRADRARKRAAAVRDVLVSQFGVSGSRLVLDADGSAASAPAEKRRAGSAPVVFSRN